jgi:hypothetical protein
MRYWTVKHNGITELVQLESPRSELYNFRYKIKKSGISAVLTGSSSSKVSGISLRIWNQKLLNFGQKNTNEISELQLDLPQTEVYIPRYKIMKSVCQQSFTDSGNLPCFMHGSQDMYWMGLNFWQKICYEICELTQLVLHQSELCSSRYEQTLLLCRRLTRTDLQQDRFQSRWVKV